MYKLHLSSCWSISTSCAGLWRKSFLLTQANWTEKRRRVFQRIRAAFAYRPFSRTPDMVWDYLHESADRPARPRPSVRPADLFVWGNFATGNWRNPARTQSGDGSCAKNDFRVRVPGAVCLSVSVESVALRGQRWCRVHMWWRERTERT